MPSSIPLFYFITCLSFCILPFNLLGSTPLNEEDYKAGALSMSSIQSATIDVAPFSKEDQRLHRKTQKRKKLFAKIEKKISNTLAKTPLGSISDRDDKWFWIFSISWGLGLLITLISGATIVATGIGILWFLSFGIGSVALIIWLLRRYG